LYSTSPSTSTLSWSDLQLSEDSSSGQEGPSSKLEDPVKGAAFDSPPSTWRLPREESSSGQEGPSSKVEDPDKGTFDPQPSTWRLPPEESSSGQEAPPTSMVSKAVQVSPSKLEVDAPFTPPTRPAKKAKKESKLR